MVPHAGGVPAGREAPLARIRRQGVDMFLAAGVKAMSKPSARTCDGGYVKAAAGPTMAMLLAVARPSRTVLGRPETLGRLPGYPGDSDTAFRASSAGVLQRTQILDVSLRFVQPASGSGDLPPAGGKGKAAVRSQQPWVVHCAV